MKIVITGATSFLGTAIIKKLLLLNHEVIAVVRPGSSNRDALRVLEESSAAVKASHIEAGNALGGNALGSHVLGGHTETSYALGGHAADMDRTPESPAMGNLTVIELELGELELLKGKVDVSCDIFLHLGWDGAGSENRTKREMQQKNISYVQKALESARDLGCRRFLFSGSQAEYGVCQSLMSEDIACHPVSEYGKAKLEASRMAAGLCETWRNNGVCDIEYIHARIFSIYGTGDHPWSLVNTCLDTFLGGGHMDLGACTQQWNFLYIDDLVDGMLSLIFCEHLPGEKGAGAGIYNIAGDEDATMPLREYVETMYRLCGKQGGFTYGKLPVNAEGPANLIPDIRKMKRVTGWRPVISFEEGIRRMLEDK